ncbi:MAG: hypothetical protein AAB581_02805 [Patescibacteria group bacterium]
MPKKKNDKNGRKQQMTLIEALGKITKKDMRRKLTPLEESLFDDMRHMEETAKKHNFRTCGPGECPH